MFGFLKYFESVHKRIDKLSFWVDLTKEDLKAELFEHDLRIRKLEEKQERREEELK